MSKHDEEQEQLESATVSEGHSIGAAMPGDTVTLPRHEIALLRQRGFVIDRNKPVVPRVRMKGV
jgi:hypothetical protein